jgi:hypothetical protein
MLFAKVKQRNFVHPLVLLLICGALARLRIVFLSIPQERIQ